MVDDNLDKLLDVLAEEIIEKKGVLKKNYTIANMLALSSEKNEADEKIKEDSRLFCSVQDARKGKKSKKNPSDKTHYRYDTRKAFCEEYRIDKDTLKKRLSDKGTYLGQHVVEFNKKLWVPFASYEQLRKECKTDKKGGMKKGK